MGTPVSASVHQAGPPLLNSKSVSSGDARHCTRFGFSLQVARRRQAGSSEGRKRQGRWMPVEMGHAALPPHEDPQTLSWTGRFAQFLPMQTTRSIHCSFNAAKVQGIRGFWLRSNTLCSLTLTSDAATGGCTMSVFLQGQLHWQCSLTAAATQCALLTPQQTQQGWVLVAACAGRTEASEDQEVASKCCFCFEGDAQNCAGKLQEIRERRSTQQQNAAPPGRGSTAVAAYGAAEPSMPARHDGRLIGMLSPVPTMAGMADAAPYTLLRQAEARQEECAGFKQPSQAHALAATSDTDLLTKVKEALADPAFRRLVDRVDALWDDLDLPGMQ